MTLTETIVSVFEEIAADRRRTLAPLTAELKLAECGLDSLGLAIAVATLEERLGIEELSQDGWTVFPVTFGDFVRLYATELMGTRAP